MKRWGMRCLLLALALRCLISPAAGAEETAPPLGLDCQAAMLLDVESGQPIFCYRADRPMVPASLTKLLTAYMVYAHFAEQGLGPDTVIPISQEVYALSQDPGLSNVDLYPAEVYTAGELLDALLISSACAVGPAFADYISGSEAAFVERMNQTAADLGLEASFADSYGLSADNRITARSLTRLVCLLTADYPQVLDRTSLPAYDFHGEVEQNTNWLVRPDKTCYTPAVTGLKTGLTKAAGYCVAVTAEVRGRAVVAVVLKGSGGDVRFDDARRLLDYAGDFFDWQAGDPAAPAPVKLRPAEMFGNLAEKRMQCEHSYDRIYPNTKWKGAYQCSSI